MKKRRQAEIIEIVKEMAIENQAMLLNELEKRGYSTTQATISRDIAQLGLEKIANSDGINCYSYVVKPEEKLGTIFRQSVINVDYAMNIVCLKCYSGLGNAACAAFDNMKEPSVVGTIAGDDTVFILVKTEESAKTLSEEIQTLL